MNKETMKKFEVKCTNGFSRTYEFHTVHAANAEEAKSIMKAKGSYNVKSVTICTLSYEAAKAYVIKSQKAFIGDIMREFDCAFREAATAIESMQTARIVSEPRSGIRKVLVQK